MEDFQKPIKTNGFPEPSYEDYLCRSCTGSDFSVEIYFTHEIPKGKKYIDSGIMSGALVCKTCDHAVRIDVGAAIKKRQK